MEFLLKRIQDDVNYLKSQGKQIKEIRMNPKVLEVLGDATELIDVNVSEGVAAVFGINIEADDSYENYVFILDEVT